MGRAHEVRAKAMAATAAKRSAAFMRASKEIYMAAKSGTPDPACNLALRSAIEKWRGQNVTKDVIDRAIKKAAGGDQESFIAGRYEAFGPGNSYLIVDTLSNNVNRALSDVKQVVVKKGGHMGSVIYNFTEYGVFDFNTDKSKEEIEENLIMSEVDLQDVSIEEGIASVLVTPSDFGKCREALNQMGVNEFETAEIMMIANDKIDITDPEDKRKFSELLDMLDECEDVQAVYHNVNL